MKGELLIQNRNTLARYVKVNQVEHAHAFQNLENQRAFSLCAPRQLRLSWRMCLHTLQCNCK